MIKKIVKSCRARYHSRADTLFVNRVLAAAVLFSFISTWISGCSPAAEQANNSVLPDPIVLVWEYTGIDTELNSIGPMEPVNVVSPTWFHLDDSDGNIRSSFDQDYLDWARERDYLVWALVTNSFDPELTASFLSNRQSRNYFIDSLVELALVYELDGINIDFENFHSDYRDSFTIFIRELSKRCSEANLTLSVDVTMISGSEYWSLNYDRASLAKEADYIVLMAYDEHWQSSPVAGSVASLPWVEEGLKRVLQEVPAEQLILGIPFYTRLFEIDQSGTAPQVLNSWSYSMHRAEEIISNHDAEVFWDEASGQHVARYEKNGLTYKMWLEDAVSIQQRLELAQKYNLAGVAAWRRGLEKPEIWAVMEANISANP